MWLLLVIHLSIAMPGNWQETNPGQIWEPHVVNVELADTFASEKNCQKKIQEFFRKANEAGKPVPRQINMGCMPLNGKNA